jgi:predicted negative regulator of RcsB-dependent stress response
MRNKPYVAAAGVPAVLLLLWAFSLWWNENGIMSLIVGGLAAALFVAAYRISQAASFAPQKKSNWNASRSEGVTRWLDSQAEDDERPATRP